MHNTTWAPHTMLSFRKKLKSQFQDIFLKEVWTNLIHRTPLAMAGSDKRISQLRVIAVDNKKKN